MLNSCTYFFWSVCFTTARKIIIKNKYLKKGILWIIVSLYASFRSSTPPPHSTKVLTLTYGFWVSERKGAERANRKKKTIHQTIGSPAVKLQSWLFCADKCRRLQDNLSNFELRFFCFKICTRKFVLSFCLSWSLRTIISDYNFHAPQSVKEPVIKNGTIISLA